jgi:hypothetical protein
MSTFPKIGYLDYPSKPVPPETETDSSPPVVLNYAQASRHIRKGGEYYAIEVQPVSDPDTPSEPEIPPEPPPMLDTTLGDTPSPPKKQRTKQPKDPPTQEELDRDVRKAIADLKASIQPDTPPTNPIDLSMQKSLHGSQKRSNSE